MTFAPWAANDRAILNRCRSSSRSPAQSFRAACGSPLEGLTPVRGSCMDSQPIRAKLTSTHRNASAVSSARFEPTITTARGEQGLRPGGRNDMENDCDCSAAALPGPRCCVRSMAACPRTTSCCW
jgi:hypothetical protein